MRIRTESARSFFAAATYADAVRVAALASALLLAYVLVPFGVRAFRFPVGADASVYLWWMNLAGAEGLSVLGSRAGLPAAALVASEGLGISPVTLLAGLQCALGAAVGLAAAAMFQSRSGWTMRAWLVGALTGVFAIYVAAGYFSSLAFGLLFLGAAACLAIGTGPMTLLAVLQLGAAVVTHPLFAPGAAAVLALAAVLAWRDGELDEAARIGAAVGGGGVVGGIVAVALVAGPPPFAADTSRDGFLRRAGLLDLLRQLYVRRLLDHWWNYALFASVPLAVVGVAKVDGFTRRLLLAWAATSALGIAVGAASGWFPSERVLSSAFVLPILAALGIERLLERRSLPAISLACLGAIAIVAGAGWTWWHTAPPVYEVEAARATDAARYAAATPPGTPLVFQAAGPQPVLTFFAVRAANELRAAMPPDRIRDVYVTVPRPPSGADPERQALWARSEAAVAEATRRTALTPLTFRLTAFLRAPFDDPAEASAVEAIPGVAILGPSPDPVASIDASLSPSSFASIAVTAFGLIAGLALVGSGWTWAASSGHRVAVSVAPAVGLASLTLVTVSLERAGVSIERRAGAVVVLVLATASGWALAVVVSRLRRRRLRR